MSDFVIKQVLCKDYPSPQTALDIFKDTWVSTFPGAFKAGTLDLFHDPRITKCLDCLGDVSFALDLGSLEGGHPYILEKAGINVVAIEANPLLYLKCLIMKEMLGMERVSFLHGDIIQFLKYTELQFDLCNCSGILYHMTDPIHLLELISTIPNLIIWTQVYDTEDDSHNTIMRNKPCNEVWWRERSFKYYLQTYADKSQSYCGGPESTSNWMDKKGILEVLDILGYRVGIVEEGNNVNGSYLLLACRKI